MKRHLVVYSLFFLLFCILSCRNKQVIITEDTSAHDLEQIKIVANSSFSLFTVQHLISFTVGKTWVSSMSSVNNSLKI